MIEISDSSFNKEVIKKSVSIPLVVDFWASWCAPCRIISPILERIERDYKGKFILAKLNVEDNMERANEYKIMSIPNVKMFKNGKIVDEFVGAIPESQIKNWLNKNIPN